MRARRISTPPPITRPTCASGQQWLEVENQRMDAHDRGRRRPRRTAAACAICARATGSWWGCAASASPRNRRSATGLSFAFMSNGISSERQVETAVRQTAALVRHALEQKQKVLVVAGPVVVHTGGVAGLASLIRGGWVHGMLSGNALGVHDVEAALLGTSLGVRLSDGRQEEHGHRNHMRAINAIYHAGSVSAGGGERTACARDSVRVRESRRAFRAGRQPARRRPAARHHHRHECRAGRLRRAAQETPAWCCAWARMLHSIATGNMLPSWVQDRVRGHQSGGGHQGQRPRHRPGGREWWPMSDCSSICSRKPLPEPA